MKYTLVIISFLLFLGKLSADDTYVFSTKMEDYFPATKYYLLDYQETNPENCTSILIKSTWGGGDIVYKWKGISKNNSEAQTLNADRIFSIIEKLDIKLIIYSRDNKLYISNFNSDLKFLSELELENVNPYSDIRVKYIKSKTLSRHYFLINQTLYEIILNNENKSYLKISNNAVDAIYLSNANKLIFAEKMESSYFLKEYSTENTTKLITHLPYFSMIKIHESNKNIFVLSSNENTNSTLVKIIRESKIQNKFWIESKIDNIQILTNENVSNIAFIEENNDNNFIKILEVKNNFKIVTKQKISIENNLLNPISLYHNENMLFAFFYNGVVLLDQSFTIISNDNHSLGQKISNIESVDLYNDQFIVHDKNSSAVFKIEENNLWLLNRFIASSGKFIIPAILLVILIIFIQLYRHQKRLLQEILELPNAGIILVVDQLGRLVRANDVAKEFLRINKAVPLKKNYADYFTDDKLNSIKEILEEAVSKRIDFKKKFMLMEKSEFKEWISTVVTIRNIAGNYRGFIFTGIDITEQLGRKRLYNLAQLAHDMQTNLSTIKLNAELLDDSDPSNLERKKKINHQIKILMNRVRDIVTVGRSEELNKSNVFSNEIVYEVRSEFDETMFPDVDFEINIKSFQLYCDRAKIVRAFRNAVENGIKSMKGQRKGLIKIKAWESSKVAYFKISDNGSGMDEETKEKMLKPYFTTAKSNGGSGIGTMIMQQVIDSHNGTMTIDSELEKGTSILFAIPNRKN